MRSLNKPNFNVKEIVEKCAESIRNEERKKRYIENSDYIYQESALLDKCAEIGELNQIKKEETVNNVLSAIDMIDLYEQKFAKHPAVKPLYYDKIMGLAVNGKCPICGIGQVSTLDHYLAKSLYPVYTVTPINLIPVCKDCNFSKLDFKTSDDDKALLHPYYDNIDNIEWLCAEIIKEGDEITALYFVNKHINERLYKRLQNHFLIYKLKKAYAVQAATEIAENRTMWKNKYDQLGGEGLIDILKESLESKEQYMRNTWNTALLRALIKNIDVFANF